MCFKRFIKAYVLIVIIATPVPDLQLTNNQIGNQKIQDITDRFRYGVRPVINLQKPLPSSQ
jgi:hypothetical protein